MVWELNTRAVGAVFLTFTTSAIIVVHFEAMHFSEPTSSTVFHVSGKYASHVFSWSSGTLETKDMNPLYSQTKVYLNTNTPFFISLSLPYFPGASMSRFEFKQCSQCKRLGVSRCTAADLHCRPFLLFQRKSLGLFLETLIQRGGAASHCRDTPTSFVEVQLYISLPFSATTSSATTKQTAASSRPQLSATACR